MTYLHNRKVIVGLIIVIVIIVIWVAVKATYSRIPNLKDFNAQKAYAQRCHNQAERTSEGIFFSPNVVVGEFLKWTIGENSWKKSVKAQLYLINKYPDKVKGDVDVYGWLGDSYRKLRRPEQARKAYEKQLKIFKEKYFKKQYPERAHLSDSRALVEEVRYIVRAHYNIAATYNAQKKYQEAIKQYDAAIKYIDELQDIKPFVWDDIFIYPFRSKGKIYKVIFKDYDAAIKNYELMKEKLKTPTAMSEADIFIGDTYLAKGDIKKAKVIYKRVVEEYKPKKQGMYNFAENRLRNLKKGKIVATDGVLYEIKDGKVKVSLI